MIVRLQGRAEYAPRSNPTKTSLVSIIRAAPNGYKPSIAGKSLYDGPEGHNPCYDVAEDEIDTLAIVNGRRQLTEAAAAVMVSFQPEDTNPRRLAGIEPGKGWELISEKPGECDGGYYSICGRSETDDCPALGHHDSRGAIAGTEYSGWIVMDIPVVKEGLILLRFSSWFTHELAPMTQDWTSVNNERRMLRLSVNDTHTQTKSSHLASIDVYDPENPFDDDKRRRLRTIDDFPETFKFEYSINGKVTTLSKEEFIARRTEPQRVTELISLLDDPSFSGSNVEVAIRLRDCGKPP